MTVYYIDFHMYETAFVISFSLSSSSPEAFQCKHKHDFRLVNSGKRQAMFRGVNKEFVCSVWQLLVLGLSHYFRLVNRWKRQVMFKGVNKIF